MEICKHCGKEFRNYRQLNGHMRMHGKSNGGFSVSRKWPSSKKKEPRLFRCLNCDKEKTWLPSCYNKYCGPKCQHEYQFKTIHIPSILKGEKTADSGSVLRKYIIETCGEKCALCNLGIEWNGSALTLQLDHIDGDSDNNFPDNLRLLCPNCHSQTPTWGSKKRIKLKKDKRNSLRRKRYYEIKNS